MTERLETDRLILRKPAIGDEAGYIDYYTSDRSAPVGGPRPRLAAWNGFAAMLGHWALRGYGRFVIVEKSTGTAIGHCGPWHPEGFPEAEIAWTLWSDDATGKGYATEAAAAARDHAFGALGWQTAVSYIVAENTASRRVADRLGAVPDKQAPCPEGLDCLVYRHARGAA